MLTLTSKCYYTQQEELPQCMLCGRAINYVHVLESDEREMLEVGKCCAIKHKDKRGPLNGRYDWRLKDIREKAYWEWYCESISRAK